MGTKILIADDESDIVSMLGSFFESKGFRVLPAFNGGILFCLTSICPEQTG